MTMTLTSVVLGAFATFATVFMVVIYIILAQSVLDQASKARTTTMVLAVAEAMALPVLCCLVSSHMSYWQGSALLARFDAFLLVAALLLCTLAAGVSVGAAAFLSNVASTLPAKVLGSKAASILAGAAAALGIAFALQLLFLVFHLCGRMQRNAPRCPLHVEQGLTRSARLHDIKSIPYHETSFSPERHWAGATVASSSPPGYTSGETSRLFPSSVSQMLRPVSSKTHLLCGSVRSQRSARINQPNSVYACREPTATQGDGFDSSCCTSAIDPGNRKTVLEISPPPPLQRFLETIPASPINSKSPSPGSPLETEHVEPPPAARRSRSFSASARGQSVQPTLMQHSSAIESHVSEAHIHPLFRSDSSTPPPVATLGTVVVAAPNAGQVISDRCSIRSLGGAARGSRPRSGSLPTVPSPLSCHGIFKSAKVDRRSTESTSPESRADDDSGEGSSAMQRQWHKTDATMTPSLPDFVLHAGSRTSLFDYQFRKQLRSSDASNGTQNL